MIDRDTEPADLSPSGAHRRDTMLRELQAEMPRLHRRRRGRRAAAGVALLVMAAAATAIVALPRRPGTAPPSAPVAQRTTPIVTPEAPDTPPAPAPAPAPARTIVFDYVPSSRGVIERTEAHGTGLIEIIDDTALALELVAMNRPAGVVRRDGRVWLTADVVDEL